MFLIIGVSCCYSIVKLIIAKYIIKIKLPWCLCSEIYCNFVPIEKRNNNICIGVFLDFVYYNSSAIKFYENINDNLYDWDCYRAKDCIFLGKIINMIIIIPLNIVNKIINIYFFLSML